MIGRTIRLDAVGYVVVGMMKPGQDNPAFGLLSRRRRGCSLRGPSVGADRRALQLLVVARLREGVSHEQARAEMARVSAELQREYPDTHRALATSVQPLGERIVRQLRRPMWMLFVAVLCVLAAACGNVANLLLARAVTGSRELTVRSALGASALRLASGRLVDLSLAGWRRCSPCGLPRSSAARCGPPPAGLGLPVISSPSLRSCCSSSAARRSRAGFSALCRRRQRPGTQAGAETLRAGRSTGGAGEQGVDPVAGDDGSDGGAGAALRRCACGVGFHQLACRIARLRRRRHGHLPRLDPRRVQPRRRRRGAPSWNRHSRPSRRRRGSTGPASSICCRCSTWSSRTGVASDPSAAPDAEVRYPVRFVSPGALDALGVPLLGGRGIMRQDEQSARPVAVISAHAARRLFAEARHLAAAHVHTRSHARDRRRHRCGSRCAAGKRSRRVAPGHLIRPAALAAGAA